MVSGGGKGDGLGPFTEVVPSQMTLTNLTDRTVNFKIKTTAPRFYCVRPNSGQVHGGQSVKVSVMLQPVDSVQTLEKERSRHKFMVQSALATEVDSVETFWKTVDPLDVTDTRLKVGKSLKSSRLCRWCSTT